MQLPSKTRFLAAQFKVFLEGDYWRELASIGISLAEHLSEQSRQIPGVEIIQKTQANSVFARIPKHWNKDSPRKCVLLCLGGKLQHREMDVLI